MIILNFKTYIHAYKESSQESSQDRAQERAQERAHDRRKNRSKHQKTVSFILSQSFFVLSTPYIDCTSTVICQKKRNMPGFNHQKLTFHFVTDLLKLKSHMSLKYLTLDIQMSVLTHKCHFKKYLNARWRNSSSLGSKKFGPDAKLWSFF